MPGWFFKIFGMRVHIADKFQVDCSKRLGATGTQHRVFPINFASLMVALTTVLRTLAISVEVQCSLTNVD